MFAIVDIQKQQFKVEAGQEIFVHRLKEEEGSTVEFDRILLLDDDGKTHVGEPILEGKKIRAKVLSHLKGDKVIVFKKKRRKGYRVKNGHRQYLSQIKIDEII